MATPTVDELIDEAGRALGNPDSDPTDAEYWLAERCAAAEADLARLMEAAVSVADIPCKPSAWARFRLVLREIKEKRDEG